MPIVRLVPIKKQTAKISDVISVSEMNFISSFSFDKTIGFSITEIMGSGTRVSVVIPQKTFDGL